MKRQPLFDRVLVKPIPEGRVSTGGLLMPDVARQSRAFAYGDVVAVGPGRLNTEGKRVPCSIKAGDVVSYPRRSRDILAIPQIDDQGNELGSEHDLLLMREPEILEVIEDYPRPTSLVGLDNKLLSMVPSSRGLPDAAYKNEEEIALAIKEGFAEPEDYVDDFAPGDGPSS